MDQRNVVRQTEDKLTDSTQEVIEDNIQEPRISALQYSKTKDTTDDSSTEGHGSGSIVGIQAPLRRRMSLNQNDEEKSSSEKETIVQPRILKNKNIKIRKIQQIEFSPSPKKLDERRYARRMLSFASPESDLCLTPTNNEGIKYSPPLRKVHPSQLLSVSTAKNSPKYEKSDCHFSPSASSNVRQEPNLSLLVTRFHEVGKELKVWSHEDRQYTIDRLPVMSTIAEEGTPEFPPNNSEQNVCSNFRAGAHSSLNLCVRL